MKAPTAIIILKKKFKQKPRQSYKIAATKIGNKQYPRTQSD